MHMTVRALLAAVAVASVAVTIGMSSPASAAAGSLPGTTAVAPAAACGTFFSPEVPNGASMNQTYVNCSNSSVQVCPAHIIAGVYHVDEKAEDLGPGAHGHWFWSSTEPGTSYTTVFCDGDAPFQNFNNEPCWTHFNPGNPNGGPMFQTYGNCFPGTVSVAPAYWKSGSLHEALPTGTSFVAGGGGIEWYWPSTVQGASYTTVFNDEYGAVTEP
jgi:hypothetical protein